MRVSRTTVAASLCGLLLFGACDSAPGPGSPGGRPPVVSGLTYTPANVVATQIPPDRIVDGRARVPFSFSVTVDDPDRDVERVGFAVQSPLPEREALVHDWIEASGPGRYDGSAEVRIPVGEIGTYTLLVYAVDRAGRMSNEVLGSLVFDADGGPPVIERVEGPDVIVRPPSGSPDRTVTISAVVTDPDGAGTIRSVVFWNVNTPGTTIPLYDDGDEERSGDAEAGDGRFTRILTISSGNQPGTNTFAFQATDRSGQTSNIVEKQIRVE